MPNMEHCRFSNTLADLKDCYAYMEDDLSEAEQNAKFRLLIVCDTIAREYADYLKDEKERRGKAKGPKA